MKLGLLATTSAILISSTAYAGTEPAEDQRLWACIGVFDATATAEKEAQRVPLYKNFQTITAQAKIAALKSGSDLPQSTRDNLLEISKQSRSQSLMLFRTSRQADAYSEVLNCFRYLIEFSERHDIDIHS